VARARQHVASTPHLLPPTSLLRTCAYVQGLLHEVGAAVKGMFVKLLRLKHGAVLRTDAPAVCKRWIIMMPSTNRSDIVTNNSGR
jgi:hypothetical protein